MGNVQYKNNSEVESDYIFVYLAIPKNISQDRQDIESGRKMRFLREFVHLLIQIFITFSSTNLSNVIIITVQHVVLFSVQIWKTSTFS